MITAIFEMGIFTAKLKIPSAVYEYRIPVSERLKVMSFDIGSPIMTSNPKVLVFELREQIGRNKFKYTFKEIN